VTEAEQLVEQASGGNEDAVYFLRALFHAFHVVDDAFDQDKLPARPDVEKALWALCSALPRNKFYRQYPELQTLVESTILDWYVANRLEAGDGQLDLQIAFIVRSSYLVLLQHVALITQGFDKALEVGLAARRLFHSEGYEGYLAALHSERAKRNVLQRQSSGTSSTGLCEHHPDSGAVKPESVQRDDECPAGEQHHAVRDADLVPSGPSDGRALPAGQLYRSETSSSGGTWSLAPRSTAAG